MKPDYHEMPLVLAIETSCDDTAVAVLDGSGAVLSSAISSQLEAHRPYGGVVPEVASREHIKNWEPVRAQALREAGVILRQIEVVAATRGPGLIGSLLVGLSLGRSIAYALKLPFHAVHHLEGHLYSPFLRPARERAQAIPERFVGLVVSGGHTTLYEVSPEGIETVAETRDDAMGEVFDKVGKRLGLPYPQGPRVDELAELGDPAAPRLSIARCSDGSPDFSYSGLKSQALVEIHKLEAAGVDTELGGRQDDEIDSRVLDLLAGFRAAAVGQILNRLNRVLETREMPILAVSGGAAANRLLRRELTSWCGERGIDLRLVALCYSSDNAAMIAHAALVRHRRGLSDDPLGADAASRLPIPAL